MIVYRFSVQRSRATEEACSTPRFENVTIKMPLLSKDVDTQVNSGSNVEDAFGVQQ